MIYEFNCEACNKSFEVKLPMADSCKPLNEPCPMCGTKGKIFRVWQATSFQHEMGDTQQKRAGREFNDILTDIHKKAGRKSTMGNWI